MEKQGNISVIGTGEVGTKIASLFEKAGLKVAYAEDFQGEMANCDLVIECLPVNLEARKENWHEWDKQIQTDAVLATTAPAEVSEIAGVTERPSRVVGLAFTPNPFDDGITHVQIAKGLETSTETVEVCRNILEKAGATVAVVQDSPGLVLDRALASVINEAAVMYTNGVATIEDIDKIPRLCLNWPMGPFELADTIGLDRVLTCLETLSRYEGPRFIPCRLLREMVAINRLGKKTGRGFYTYE